MGAELQNEALRRARRRRSAWLTMVVASTCFVALASATGVLLFRRYHAQAAALPAAIAAPSPVATAAAVVPTPVANTQPESKPSTVVPAAPVSARPVANNQGPALADMSPVAAALVKAGTPKTPATRHVPVLDLTGHAVASGRSAASAEHATYSPQPRYPMLATENHIEGDVYIQAQIDANGKATRMKVVSGPPLLYQAAMEALRQWKFEPSRLDGNPVDSQTVVTIQFRLK
jgi:TonB family protein